VSPQLLREQYTREIKAIGEGEVHVWGINLDDASLEKRDVFREVLSEDEKTRASRLLPGVYGERFVTARGYLRTILGLYLDIPPGGIRFEYLRHGKPALHAEANPKNISFNLSHSRSLALCAVSVKREIGIDVEYPRPVLMAERILERFFSDDEREYYRSQPETIKECAFMNLWTMKEAYSKALGRGLTSDLRDIDLSPVLSDDYPSSDTVRLDIGPGGTWTIRRFSPGDEYMAAVALKGEASGIKSFTAPAGLP